MDAAVFDQGADPAADRHRARSAEGRWSSNRDPWGIPQLWGDDANRLAFAQGHNVAIDRAWQIEVERHRAQGSSAAFLGRDALGWDRFARRSRLADTARRCFANLDPETATWVRHYVAGVNAGLPEGTGRAPEFAATGLAPGHWQPWTPLAVWLSHHILFAGFPNKLWRDEVARRLGPGTVGLFAIDGANSSGSNGWLLSGARTASGAALLAGDPHRFIEDPGIYQQVRLACPEYDVLGLAVPGVPGIPHFGHTGEVAWAITNAMADYQDLYTEQLRRTGTAVEALGPEGWRGVSAHTEIIEVAGGEPVEIEVIETERGPVIIGGPGEPSAISLRYPPRVHGRLGFEALPALLRATRVADVDRAFDGWVEPVNVVQAADRAGGLLHRVAGSVPLRHQANRLRVVPAWVADHQWHGWYDPMPRADPAEIAVMANDRGISAPLGVEFAPPHRATRIRELLAASTDWTAERLAAVHTDTLLPRAEPLLPLVTGLDGLSPAAAALRDRLTCWDRRMAADSADAAGYAALRTALVRRLAAHPALRPLADPMPYPELFQPWLNLVSRVGFALPGLLAADLIPGPDRTALARAALEEVAATGEGAVVWGERHRLAPWRAGPGPAGQQWPGLAGDHDCVLATSSVPGLTDLSSRVPVARYVWDLADRDRSRWVVPFGAAGPPDDPHHFDQLPAWLNGRLLPVPSGPATQVASAGPAGGGTAGPGGGGTAGDRNGRQTCHERHIDGFGRVSIRPVDPDRDSGLIHSWVTQDRARFWGMTGADPDRVREIYTFLNSLTTHHAYLVLRDGRPVGLFQTYEPAADPVGDRYPVLPGDFGIHLMIGPPVGGTEPNFTGTLLAAFLDFVLTDPSRTRIVAEPDVRNARAIARFTRAGFVPGPQIDLPEKRAQLLFLTRAGAVAPQAA